MTVASHEANGRLAWRPLAKEVQAIMIEHGDQDQVREILRTYISAREFGRAIDFVNGAMSSDYMSYVMSAFIRHAGKAGDRLCMNAVATSEAVFIGMGAYSLRRVAEQICETGVGVDPAPALLFVIKLIDKRVDMAQALFSSGVVPDPLLLRRHIIQGRGPLDELANRYVALLEAFVSTRELEAHFAADRPCREADAPHAGL